MHNLHQLIEKLGSPDALIDHWYISSIRFAIWDFEEEFFIDSIGRSFMNGKLIEEKKQYTCKPGLLIIQVKQKQYMVWQD